MREKKVDGVAPLITDPPRGNYAPLQNPPIAKSHLTSPKLVN